MTVAKNYKAELVGVFGCPVAENPTIVMQEAAFKALNLHFRYLTIEVKPEDLEAAIRGLRAFNMKGINLTIPHKVEVIKYLDEITPDAQLIGAVNTVYREGEKLWGTNTDGKGFLKSLREADIDPAGKQAVVLGSGGAARAIAVELALAGMKKITIVNRNSERGHSLVALLNEKTNAQADFVLWSQPFAVPDGTNIVVNATSIGLYPQHGALPNLVYETIKPEMTLCDVIPNPPRTLFLQEAEKRGAQTLDGLGMLVNQGVIGFKIWTGRDAPAAVMKEALLQEFGQ